jgi:CubicO group peptidase (beta-lactamase class C family)
MSMRAAAAVVVVSMGVIVVATSADAVMAAPATSGPATKPAPAASIDDLLEGIRAKHDLPGLVGAIVEGDDVIAIGAAGVRKVGAPDRITIDDKLHLGSCTKAMTATILARLIERKQLDWDSTIGQVFPDLAPSLDEGYRAVTLEQLFHHRAGLPANTTWAILGSGTTTVQRVNVIKIELAKKPESEPGTKFAYSNVGYAVAGAMGEKVTGKSWETLIRKELFEPLGMTSAGFGPPGTKGKVDQPWGHLPAAKVALPAQADNPPSLGPAGRVHCTIRDWAKFVSLHLRGERGEEKAYLSPETFASLHRPPPGGDYAAGWVVLQRPWGGGTVLTHAGSNTMWYCVVWMAPKRNFAVLAVTNIGGDEAAKACDEASSAMIGRFYQMRPKAKLPTTRGHD